ncbi:MAG: hypothetical protein RLZZ297_1882 [Chloroflexota bacterium]
MHGTVIARMEGDTSTIEVIEYPSLNLSRRPDLAAVAYYAREMGVHLRQLRITLNDGAATIEPGMLQFSHGAISANSQAGGLVGFVKRFFLKKFNKETIFRTTFTGTGVIYTEPTFDHYLLTRIAPGEEAVVADGRYVASEASVETGVAVKNTASSLLFNRDDIVRTSIKGKGWCVVQSPIAASEVIRVDLVDQELRVDGDLVLLRKGKLTQSVGSPTTDYTGVFTAGEGLVQVYRGTGQLWLAPAEHGYEHLIDLLQAAGIPYGTPTTRKRTFFQRIQDAFR